MKIKHLTFSFFLFILGVGMSFSSLAADDVPDTLPPTHIDGVAACSVKSSNTVDIIILEESENAQLEIIDSDGILVYQRKGEVRCNDRVKLNSKEFRGKPCIVRVQVNGRYQQFTINWK